MYDELKVFISILSYIPSIYAQDQLLSIDYIISKIPIHVLHQPIPRHPITHLTTISKKFKE